MIDVEKLREDVAGFRGRFAYIGDGDFVFISNDPEHEGEHYEIATEAEEHVIEPMARMLNAPPELLAVYEAACAWRDNRDLTSDLKSAVDAARKAAP